MSDQSNPADNPAPPADTSHGAQPSQALLPPPNSSPPKHPTLEAFWEYLEPALDHIFRAPTNDPSKAPVIDTRYYMGIYSALFGYLTNPRATSSSSPAPSPHALPPDVPGKDLYVRLDRYFESVARELLIGAPIDASPSTTLIHYLVPTFTRYASGAHTVSRLLNYFNRHHVGRLVGEGYGWYRPEPRPDGDGDGAAQSQQGDAGKKKKRKDAEARKKEALKRWGLQPEDPPERVAEIEAYAEAASPPNCVVPLAVLAHRRFRLEVIEPLLEGEGEGGGRLARAVEDLLRPSEVETAGENEEERQRLAAGLADVLRTVGLEVGHPLRTRLDQFLRPGSVE
ncbi:hypothetical protein C8Q76DRAFT_606386 [Earliella scabrosa]|nr:hypothetical protein C8Q76DRAFT_606386 [Earliella scabrosa]